MFGGGGRATGDRVNPGAWREIEGRFRELRKQHGDGLVANWISTEHGERWVLSGSTNDRERTLFAWVAERAIVELGHSGGDTALADWLDLLKGESPNFRSGTILTQSNPDGATTEEQTGTIHRVIEASADYCVKLETRAIIQARSPEQAADEKSTVPDVQRHSEVPSGKRPVRRSKTLKTIDEKLEKIADIHPQTQEEVFEALNGRVIFPQAEPFKTARGWLAGFRDDEAMARAWLSKRWGELNLAPLPRGPKKPRK
jgi:hypothetical protein